ncbi:hypothetical protein BBJ28_00005725 [Nothophytophthora sp. Chile5]|nr:hypothetical protein BBJ28_00005725 [Nothophytophthora sp. Chile5]
MLFVLLATVTHCAASIPECKLIDLVIIEGLANYDLIKTYRAICNTTGYDIYPFKKPPTDTMIDKVCDNCPPDCKLKDLVVIEGLANRSPIMTYRKLYNASGYDIYPFKKPPTDALVKRVCTSSFCQSALGSFSKAASLPKCILNVNGVLETPAQHLADICPS